MTMLAPIKYLPRRTFCALLLGATLRSGDAEQSGPAASLSTSDEAAVRAILDTITPGLQADPDGPDSAESAIIEAYRRFVLNASRVVGSSPPYFAEKWTRINDGFLNRVN